MAHKQKYYKNIDVNGHLWRLEIWQDTEAELTPKEIGPVLQSLRIAVQGSQADVDTPIVKTSLEMSFIDAPGYEEERKCGYWEEFYTSAATEYLVKLYKDGQIEWSGYVTPDSFEEDLRYRGSVSIIARDNLGYLQDFKFRMHTEDGLVDLSTLLDEAKKVIDFQMNIQGAQLFPTSSNGGDLRQVLFNIAAFRDKTWWEVLEAAFYSVGATMRYVGRNSFILAPIREQSKCGYADYEDMPTRETRFLSYGHRELVPAAKSVIDVCEFDILESLVEIYAPDYQYGSQSALTFVETSQGIESGSYSMPVYEYASQSAGVPSAQAGASRLLNPYNYKLRAGGADAQQKSIHSDDVLYALSNTIRVTSYEDEQTGIVTHDYHFQKVNPVVFASRLQQGGVVDMRFTFERPVVLYPDGTIGDFVESQYGERLFLQALGFKATWEGDNGVKKYLYHATLDGGWSDTDNGQVVTILSEATEFFTNPVTVALPSLSVDGPGELRIEFYGAYFPTTVNRNGESHQGAYIRITAADIMLAGEGAVHAAKNSKVTTNYNSKNNLLIQRSAELAPNPNRPLAPQMIVNNIMVQDTTGITGAMNWTWGLGYEDMPLSVMIHKQLLCYHAQPMDLLSGELVSDDCTFDSLYTWNGKEYSLLSGSLNVLTGRIEGAVLREFMRYENLWNEIDTRVRTFALPRSQEQTEDYKTSYRYEDKQRGGMASSPDGSGYVTKKYADETYAPIALVSGVSSRLATIELYFSNAEDVDTQINKWNEIVTFLNATEETTLAGILATYATKDEVSDLLSWYNSVGVHFKKRSDGVYYVEGNLYTDGQFAATVVGTESGGSVGATYLADLFDVSLNSLVSGDVLSWNGSEWVNIRQSSLVPDLSAYATKTYVTNALTPYATTENLNKVSGRVETLEKAGYATENYVTTRGYITSSALTPYIKESVADERYATIVNLTGVSSRVKTLEDAGFALAKDVEASVAGINVELAKKATIDALNEGLNDRYTKKNVDDLFSNFKGTENITTLGIITKGVWNGTAIANEYLANSKITISGIEVALGGSISQESLRTGLGLDAILAWYESVGVKFQKQSDDTIYVDGNLVTRGQFAAMTAGEGGGSIGATNLSDLFDVSVSALTSGDLLSWNGSEWVNIKKSTLAPDLSAYATKNFVTSQGYITSAALTSYATKNDVTTALLPYATAETVNKVAGRVKTLEEAGYATETFVTSRGYITSTALSPYITKDTADGSYATIDGLDGLNSRLTAIEDYFYTVDDAEAKIDKWNEIVDFLDATEGTTLAGILAVYETKENIANTLKSYATTASLAPYAKTADVNNTLKSYATTASLNTLAGRVTTLEGKATAVSFSPSLTSGKQIGVLTIDGVAKSLYAPSMYDWSEINAKPTKLSDFTDDVVAGKYQPLATAINTSNIGEQMVGYAQRANSAVDSEKLGGLAPEMYAKNLNNATGINIDDTTFIGLRGGKTFAASGTFGYDGYSPFLEFGADGYTVQMQGRDGGFYARTCENKIWGNWFTFLHTGNYSELVLPRSGGRLQTASGTILSLNSINGSAIHQTFMVDNVQKSSLGWYDGMTYIGADSSSTARIGVTDGGVPQFWEAYNGPKRTLFHTGNFDPAEYLPRIGGTIDGNLSLGIDNSTTVQNYFRIYRKHDSERHTFLASLTDDKDYELAYYNSTVGTYARLVIGTSGYKVGGYSLYDLIHSGNYSNYALPLSGGTIEGNLSLGKDGESANPYNYRIFQKVNGVQHRASLGITDSGDVELSYYSSTNSTYKRLLMGGSGLKIGGYDYELYDILHSGNLTDYTIKQQYYSGSMPPLKTFGTWNDIGAYVRLGMVEEYSIGFRVSSGILQSLVTHGSTEGDWKTLIHEGNYSSYALPLTGGTISNGLVIASGYDNKLTLNNTDSESKYQLISFQQNGVEYGSLGTAGNDDLMWNFNTIIHSGNIEHQTVGAVKEYEVLDFVNQESATIRGWYNWGNPTETSFASHTHGIVATSLDGHIYHYLGFANAEANPRVRSISYGADSGWKTIALLDDNGGITVNEITIGGVRLYVEDGALKINGNVFATGQFAAGA